MVFAIALMVPIEGVIALLLDATLFHIIQKELGGKGTYEGTVRFVLYAFTASSLLRIPLAGGISEFTSYISMLWAAGLYMT